MSRRSSKPAVMPVPQLTPIEYARQLQQEYADQIEASLVLHYRDGRANFEERQRTRQFGLPFHADLMRLVEAPDGAWGELLTGVPLSAIEADYDLGPCRVAPKVEDYIAGYRATRAAIEK